MCTRRTKTCRSCLEDKAARALPATARWATGRHPLCKSVGPPEERDRYWRDREAILARSKRRRAKAPTSLAGGRWSASTGSPSRSSAPCERLSAGAARSASEGPSAWSSTTTTLSGACVVSSAPTATSPLGELEDDPERCRAAARYLRAVEHPNGRSDEGMSWLRHGEAAGPIRAEKAHVQRLRERIGPCQGSAHLHIRSTQRRYVYGMSAVEYLARVAATGQHGARSAARGRAMLVSITITALARFGGCCAIDATVLSVTSRTRLAPVERAGGVSSQVRGSVAAGRGGRVWFIAWPC